MNNDEPIIWLINELYKSSTIDRDFSIIKSYLDSLNDCEHRAIMEGMFWMSLSRYEFWLCNDILEYGFELDIEYEMGCIQQAIVDLGDDVKVVRWLLDHGANIEHRDLNCGNATPLMRAVGSRRLNVVRLLLDRGADFNATTIIDGNDSVLVIAVHVKFEEGIKMLRRFGADPFFVNRTGKSVRDIALESGDSAIIRAIIEPWK